MFNLKHKLPSFFKTLPLVVLLLVYLGILVAIYLASPPPGQAVRPMMIGGAERYRGIPWSIGSITVALPYVVVSLIVVVLLFTLKRKSWKNLKPLNGINPLYFFFMMGFSMVLADLIQTTFSGNYTPSTSVEKVGATVVETVGYIIPGALVSMPLILYSYIWKRWNRKAVHAGIVLFYISIMTAIGFAGLGDFNWVVDEKSPGAFIWAASLYLLYSVPFILILRTRNRKQRIAVILAVLTLFVAFHQLMYVRSFPQRSLLKLSVDVKDVPSGEISVDGDFADWSGFQPIHIDPKGDSEDPSLDIREIYAATNGKELFIAVKTSEPLAPSAPNKGIIISVDTDLDYQRDYTVSNELKDKEKRVIVRDNLMANGGEGHIEFRVPLENIEMGAEKTAINVEAMGINPYNPNQWTPYEHSDWIFLRVK